MRSRLMKFLSPFHALLLGAAVLYALGAGAVELAQQSNRAGGVSISIEPTDVSAAATSWQFKVALDTHSGALDDDLARSAILVDAAGKQYAALGWNGDPAGGHHRSGVLRFKPLSPQPEVLELRISRSGEAAARTFRWQLK